MEKGKITRNLKQHFKQERKDVCFGDFWNLEAENMDVDLRFEAENRIKYNRDSLFIQQCIINNFLNSELINHVDLNTPC
jgi:hypothetical protein